jgi:hypothetical protein
MNKPGPVAMLVFFFFFFFRSVTLAVNRDSTFLAIYSTWIADMNGNKVVPITKV